MALKLDWKREIKKQIENEVTASKILLQSTKITNNPIVSHIFYQLALDSKKHVHQLKLILHLLEDPEKSFEEEDGFDKVVKRHVEIERKMLQDFVQRGVEEHGSCKSLPNRLD